MIDFLKKKSITVVEALCPKLFGHAMGDGMKNFLGHLSWSFFGGIVASVLLFTLNILAGRVLGPEEYGKCGLVIALASVFIIPMVFGIDTASTYYIAKTADRSGKEEYIGSSLLLVLMSVVLSVFALVGMFPVIERIISINRETFYFSLGFGVFMGVRNVFDSYLRGYHLFKLQSKIRVVEALITAGSFFCFIAYLSIFEYTSYVISLLLGYALSSTIIGYFFLGKFRYSRIRMNQLLQYGSYAIWGSVSGIIIGSFDKLLVGKYLGSEQLGVYTAYSTISVIVTSQFLAIFINVFFPLLSSGTERDGILKSINKVSMYALLPFFLCIFSIIFIGIKLFGKLYPLDWLLVGEFSLYATITAYFTVLWWFINSKGSWGVKLTSKHAVAGGVLFLFLSTFFRHELNLHLLVLFLIISMVYNVFAGNIFYNRKQLECANSITIKT